MKKLMLTTAIFTGATFAAMAQTADTGTTGQQGMASTVPGILASDLTGMTLHTLDSDDVRALGQSADGLTAAERDRLRWTSSDSFIADRDSWESVGAIDDIVLSQDGAVRGVLVDVGGFLGFGARTVKIGIDQLHFVTDAGTAEDIDDVFVVVAMTEEELDALPEWDSAQLREGFELRADGGSMPDHGQEASAVPEAASADAALAETGAGTAPASAPVFTEHHRMLEGEERTADLLLGADVYDAQGEAVGAVDDLVIAADNRIEGLLVDVGGFLGIGAREVALGLDEVQFMRDGQDSWHVYTPYTQEQLEAAPEYDEATYAEQRDQQRIGIQ